MFEDADDQIGGVRPDRSHRRQHRQRDRQRREDGKRADQYAAPRQAFDDAGDECRQRYRNDGIEE